jgi:hypothetical protein
MAAMNVDSAQLIFQIACPINMRGNVIRLDPAGDRADTATFRAAVMCERVPETTGQPIQAEAAPAETTTAPKRE